MCIYVLQNVSWLSTHCVLIWLRNNPSMVSPALVTVSKIDKKFMWRWVRGIASTTFWAWGWLPQWSRRLWCVYMGVSDECLYNTDRQLLKRLRTFCRNPAALRARNFKASQSLTRSFILVNLCITFSSSFASIWFYVVDLASCLTF